jgi:hypothetical protein
VAFVVTACGPSAQEVFDQALSDGQAALEMDDLDAARSFFLAAKDAVPDSPIVLSAFENLEVIAASRNAFLEAELLALNPSLSLEAIRLYLSVAPIDTHRFSSARFAAEKLEREWASEVAEEISQLIAANAIKQIPQLVRTARRALPSSAMLEVELKRPSELVLTAVAADARELVRSGKLGEAELLLGQFDSVFPLSESPASDEIREIRDFIPQERERLNRERLEEAARRQQELLRPPRPPSPPTRRIVDGCPAPSFGDRLWEECLNRRALEETGCPSVIYDADAWQKCVFGGNRPQFPERGTVAPPPPPRAPAVQCPVARARIVVQEHGGSLRQTGAGIAELTVNLRGYVENQSSGILILMATMYEFTTSGVLKAVGSVAWTDGNTLLQPGERRGFQVAGAQHTVTSRPDAFKIYLVGPLLTAPTAELNAQCPAQMPPVNSSFGTFSSSISFD